MSFFARYIGSRLIAQGEEAVESEDYADTVDGLAGGAPLVHWRLNESSGTTMVDRKAGGLDGTYTNTVVFSATGLPANSDGGVNFAGTGYASVAHDASLDLVALSISLWFRLNSAPTPDSGTFYGIISKDASGLNIGDFAVLVTDDPLLQIHFQDASAQYLLPTLPTIEADTTYHLVVRADSTGFDAYLNGEYLGKSTSFTGAWSSNTNTLEVGRSPTSGVLQCDGVIDEVAIYGRVITEAEVLELGQRTAPPVASNDTVVVPESATTAIDVTSNDTFAGAKSGLTVTIVDDSEFDTASGHSVTVNEDNDIDFEAGAVSTDEEISFTYQITDANGTSNTATVTTTVQNSGSTGGGTLVYDFQPQADWITDVDLADRDYTDALGNQTSTPFASGSEPSPNFWRLSTGSGGGCVVGADLVEGTWNKGPITQGDVCWNFAPDGSPSLEMRATAGDKTIVDFAVKLWEEFTRETTGPSHVRVVMEIRLSSSGDPTTHRATGVGGTSGAYPNFRVTHNDPQVGVKWFCHLFQGPRHEGPILCNWWGDESLPIDRVGYMIQAGSNAIGVYMGNFDRPGIAGEFHRFNNTDIEGLEGVWHRVETEIKLTTPALVPTNARRSPTAVQPTGGDGIARAYMTRDLDGEDGGPEARKIIGELTNVIFNPRFDDMPQNFDNLHVTSNITGFWLNLHYGGAPPSNGEGYCWIRRIQVFVHDE